MNNINLREIKEKALENHVPIIMDDTLEYIYKLAKILHDNEYNVTMLYQLNEDEDFVVDTEYTWNEFDKVSVKISPENIHMKLVKEAKNYVKD